MSVCGVRTFLGPCPFVAVETVTMGCVHEHMPVGLMCQEHTDEARIPDTGNCMACWDGDPSHACGLVFISSVPLAVAA